ncbi:MAG: DNRLRE domain-containing protein [Nanoarchaeota archaeon]
MLKLAYGAAPVLDAIPSPQNLTNGLLYTYTVTATGGDGSLYYSDDTANFDIGEGTGIISFTPDASLVGSFIAVIIVRDDLDQVDAQAVNFTVNDVPSFDNLANKNVTFGNEFYYDIDATDTEDGTTLNFVDNTSLFVINISSGVINFTTTLNQIGTHNINITVNDSKNALGSGIFQLAINDQPNFTGFPSSTATEDVSFQINMSDYLNDTVGTLNFTDNFTFFVINTTTGVINFTPTNNSIGNHTINITVIDAYGLIDSDIWSLNISEVNDAPNFSAISNQTAKVDREFYLDIDATDEEGDDIYYFDNTSLFVINISTGVINFTATMDQIANYIINISVNDSNGNLYSDLFNLNISLNTPPKFPKNFTLSLNPDSDSYVDSQFSETNYKGNDFLQLADLSTSVKRAYMNFSLTEITNSSTTILYAILNLTINASLEDANVSLFRINETWFSSNITYLDQPSINTTSAHNLTSGIAGAVDSFILTGLIQGLFINSSGDYGFSVRMTNESLDSGTIKYYSSDSSNSSLWPILYIVYNHTIPDQTLDYNENLSKVFNLSDYFYDDENDNLTYGVSSTSYVNITIDANSSVSIIALGTAGTETVTFNASDGINVTDSSLVTITVTGAAAATPSSSGGGGGGRSTKKKVASLAISMDSNRRKLGEGEIIKAPLIVKNTGQIQLNDIDLVFSVDKPGLYVSLSETSITKLVLEEEKDFSLTMDTTGSLEGSYVVTINANSNSPVVVNATAFFVLDIEGESEGINEEIQLAEDLFQHNPECVELSESLDEAKILLEKGNYEEARLKVTNTIDACRTLIRSKEEMPDVSDLKLKQVLIYLSGLTVVILLSYGIFRRVKYSRKAPKT